MKTVILLMAVVLVPAGLFADVYPYKSGDKPKMMVIVQSEEAAVTATAGPGVTKVVQPQAVQQTVVSKMMTAEELKRLAEKSEMENEIVDAVIAKLIDLEEEIKKQKTYNIVFGASIFFLLLLVILGAVTSRTRGRDKK
ncbi:MAG: hypothetical protein LLG37_00340 [Spirochaetia bacterium]|nr:hypothetical protein [Spirochaetia bacterium]